MIKKIVRGTEVIIIQSYKPTKCFFTKTNYNGKLLYALHTTLVDESEQLSFIIQLGEKWDYVKQIALCVDQNGCIAAPVYLIDEPYTNDTFFFIRQNNNLQCDNSGVPVLYSSYNIKCPMYYDGSNYSYFKYNDASHRFNYGVRRGDFILATKEGRVPENVDEILRMPPRYKTEIISMSELLK